MDTSIRCACCVLLIASLGASAPATGQQTTSRSETDGAVLVIPERSQPGSTLPTGLTPAQWDRYGRCVCAALASHHEGLRRGALRLFVMYGDVFDVPRMSVFEIVRLYREHPNERVRRMAVVALARIEDAWAMDFLQRSVPYEHSPAVLHTMRAVLAEHRTVREGDVTVGPLQTVEP